MRIAFFVLFFASLAGCNHPADTFVPESEIQGAWILFEQGYSPGSGYIINPVSEDPLDYRFYRIDKNTSDTWELWLYKSEPDPLKDPEPTRLMYNVEFENGNLKLSPAFPSRCIEGCHMGFKR
jgi:hypothetical protein